MVGVSGCFHSVRAVFCDTFSANVRSFTEHIHSVSFFMSYSRMLYFSDFIATDSLVGKRVLIRADLNVPLDAQGNIVEDTRIRASLPAIQAALGAGAAVAVMSHLGRPQEGAALKPHESLAPVAKHLSHLLGSPVPLIRNWVTQDLAITPGQLVLLENCRANTGEKENADALSRKMAGLCDIYVNDAFGAAHRAHASTEGITRYAKVACAGPLLVKELNALSRIFEHPDHPLTAIIGGSKVSTKLSILTTLAAQVDQLIVGGGIANTFLLASGKKIGQSLAEPERINDAKAIMTQMEKRGASLLIPSDVVTAKTLCAHAHAQVKPVDAVADDDLILDIGPDTAHDASQQIRETRTLVWNGPVGAFELAPFSCGTQTIAQAIAHSSAFSIAGGGDTLAAIATWQIAEKISYISTGGGAFLAFLEGKTLPAVAALARAAASFHDKQ